MKSDRWRFLSSTVIFDNDSKTFVVELRVQVNANVQYFYLTEREADGLGDELKGKAFVARQQRTKTEGQINTEAREATPEELASLVGEAFKIESALPNKFLAFCPDCAWRQIKTTEEAVKLAVKSHRENDCPFRRKK